MVYTICDIIASKDANTIVSDLYKVNSDNGKLKIAPYGSSMETTIQFKNKFTIKCLGSFTLHISFNNRKRENPDNDIRNGLGEIKIKIPTIK